VKVVKGSICYLCKGKLGSDPPTAKAAVKIHLKLADGFGIAHMCKPCYEKKRPYPD